MMIVTCRPSPGSWYFRQQKTWLVLWGMLLVYAFPDVGLYLAAVMCISRPGLRGEQYLTQSF